MADKKRKPTKADCNGCYDDVYNHGCGGAVECFMFAKATMEKARDVPVDLPPPYLRIKETVRPSCYHAQRYVRVKASALDSRGFWRGACRG